MAFKRASDEEQEASLEPTEQYIYIYDNDWSRTKNLLAQSP